MTDALSSSSTVDEPFATRWLWAVLVVTTLAKLALIAATHGTADTDAWSTFALYALEQRSPFAGYARFHEVFNHPPLGTLVVASAVGFGKLLSSPFGVGFWVRVPGLLADLASAAALERLLRSRLDTRSRRLVVAGYLLSPLPAAVGIYHGNTDLVWVAVLLWAAWALECGRPALAGALVAAAVGIKLPAVVALAPLGLASLRDRRGAWFSIAFVAAVAPQYLAGVHWGGYWFVKCVLLYKGSLTAVPWPPGSLLVPVLGEGALTWFRQHGSLVVLLAVGAGAGYSWRRTRPADGLAIALGLTLLVVATFGAQYLAWFAAPAVLLGWRHALAFHVAAATQAVVIYSTTVPPFLQDPEHSGVLNPWPAVVTWLVLGATVAAALARGRGHGPGRQAAGGPQVPGEPGPAGGVAGEGGAASRA